MVDRNAGTEDNSLATLGLQVGALANRNLTSVTLSYPPSDGQIARERFIVEATKPQYGGLRYWFVCSCCFHRTQKLFRPHDEESFACRKCYDLAYCSQREHKFIRAVFRGRKLRRKLGAGPNLITAFPSKPNRMRWKTWEALRATDSEILNGALFDRLDILGLKKLRKQAKRRVTRHPRAAILSLA
jgi:hypothetical protein